MIMKGIFKRITLLLTKIICPTVNLGKIGLVTSEKSMFHNILKKKSIKKSSNVTTVAIKIAHILAKKKKVISKC